MTKRKRFRWQPPTQEELAQRWLRVAQGDLVRRAHRGDTAPLAEALRAVDLHQVADLIEDGKWRKRDARTQADEMAHEIARVVRSQERRVHRDNGGKLPRGTRPRLIEAVCTALAENDELVGLEAAQAGLPAAVRQILERDRWPAPKAGKRKAAGKVRPPAA